MTEENKLQEIRSKYGSIAHYYGDTVRKLFILAASIMVVTLPFLNHRLPTSPFVSILCIILIASVAGFINPRGKWIILLNFVITVGGVLAFEYYAIDAYTKYSVNDLLFLTDQVLAIIFVFSLYFSSKTVRASFLSN